MAGAGGSLRLLAAAPSGLYALSSDETEPQLVRVNASTGALTPVGPHLPHDYQSAEALSCVDNEAGVLYAVLFHAPFAHLVGISLATGAVLSDVNLTAFAEQQFVGIGQWVVAIGAGEVAVGGDAPDGSHVVGVVTVADGSFRRVAAVPRAAAEDTSSCAAAYVPTTRSVVFQLAYAGPPVTIAVFDVSLATGKVRSAPESYDNSTNIWTFSWDAARASIVGLGLLPNITRSLVSLDPDTLAMNAFCSQPEWLMEVGDMAALDPAGRVLYWLSQPAGTPITDDHEPWYVVGVDADSCAVRSHAWIGNGTSALPLGLVYYAGAGMP